MINETIKELTVDEQKIYELIKAGKHYSKSELAKEINKSKATVTRIIKSLTDQNLIQRVGSNKTGYWEVNKH